MGEKPGLMKAFEALDLHPKLVSDFVVRTKSGGFGRYTWSRQVIGVRTKVARPLQLFVAVSIAALLIATALFVGELKLYWTLERIEHMEVDDMRGHNMKMRVNFDVSFPNLPCGMVSLDAMDASGSHSLDVIHNVFKKRLDRQGSPIGDSKREEKGTVRNAKDLLKEKQKAIAEGQSKEGG